MILTCASCRLVNSLIDISRLPPRLMSFSALAGFDYTPNFVRRATENARRARPSAKDIDNNTLSK